MSRFYASIEGSRGEATRQGTPATGIVAHPRGWNLGVRVTGYPAQASDRDTFAVDITGGSHGRRTSIQLGDVTELEGGGIVVALAPAFGGGVFRFGPNGEPIEASEEATA
jgi:hypothetical protein